MAQPPGRSRSEEESSFSGWHWTRTRRVVLFVIGSVGLLYEILTPSDARPVLLVTDLVLVGVIPVDYMLTMWAERRAQRNGRTSTSEASGPVDKPSWPELPPPTSPAA